jgi:hypothetical protein
MHAPQQLMQHVVGISHHELEQNGDARLTDILGKIPHIGEKGDVSLKEVQLLMRVAAELVDYGYSPTPVKERSGVTEDQFQEWLNDVNLPYMKLQRAETKIVKSAMKILEESPSEQKRARETQINLKKLAAVVAYRFILRMDETGAANMILQNLDEECTAEDLAAWNEEFRGKSTREILPEAFRS